MRASLGMRSSARRTSALQPSPQASCLAGVRWADAVVLLLGGRYGHKQASGVSATHEEYREAKERCAVLAFDQRGAEHEPDQERFISEVKNWAGGVLTGSFSTGRDLRDAVTRALRDVELARAVGPVDENEILARAEALFPDPRAVYEASLTVSVAGGPRQQILRPVQIEDPELERAVAREAMFGDSALFDRTQGMRSRVVADGLLLEQENHSVFLEQLGSLRIIQPARHARSLSGRVELPVLIEEDVHDAVVRALSIAAWLLDHIDPVRRISDVVVVAAIDRAGLGWRTRAEHERNPGTVSGAFADDRTVARLAPPSFTGPPDHRVARCARTIPASHSSQ